MRFFFHELAQTEFDRAVEYYEGCRRGLGMEFAQEVQEVVCEETAEEVVLMKDTSGRVIGFELLHYRPADTTLGLAVETVVRAAA